MKMLKLIALTVLLTALTACNNNRRTDLPHDNPAVDNRTDADRTMTSPDNTQMDPTTQNDTRAWTTQDRDEMYRHLNMTQEQITRFEQGDKNSGNNMNSNATQMQRERDSRLKEILDNDQYRKYEQWRDNRMNRNQNSSGSQAH